MKKRGSNAIKLDLLAEIGDDVDRDEWSFMTIYQDYERTEYFEHFYGIEVDDNAKPEKVVLRAYDELPKYLRSLPLHPSQREVGLGERYTDFSLRLVPTHDFIQELLLHRDQIEVLQPQSLRDEMTNLIDRMNRLYLNKT